MGWNWSLFLQRIQAYMCAITNQNSCIKKSKLSGEGILHLVCFPKGQLFFYFQSCHVSQSDVTSTDDQEGISVPAAAGAVWHFKEPSLEFEDVASPVPSGNSRTSACFCCKSMGHPHSIPWHPMAMLVCWRVNQQVSSVQNPPYFHYDGCK